MDYKAFLQEWRSESADVEVMTSGSTGVPKRMLVSKDRMRASARMTCRFLDLKEGDAALLCMPLDYIAGKMMVVRSETCGLKLTVVEPSNRPLQYLANRCQPFDFVAMIPSQVYESLRHHDEAELLKRTRHLIIGGGAIPRELENELKTFPNSVWSTYGMTETLSHVAMRKINGEDALEWYLPMPGVDVSTNEDGCLMIDAPHLCSYRLTTNDLAELRDGRFRVLGRRDNVICSGGVKIHIEEVEERLAPYLKSPFAITKVKDGKFGEAVVLVTEDGNLADVEAVCKEHLPRYWQPKHYCHIENIPLTGSGKIARKEMENIILSIITNKN